MNTSWGWGAIDAYTCIIRLRNSDCLACTKLLKWFGNNPSLFQWFLYGGNIECFSYHALTHAVTEGVSCTMPTLTYDIHGFFVNVFRLGHIHYLANGVHFKYVLIQSSGINKILMLFHMKMLLLTKTHQVNWANPIPIYVRLHLTT